MPQPHVQMTRPEQAAYTLARQSFARGEDETALQAVRTLLRTREGFADALRATGRPEAGLRDAVEQAAAEIRERWATALDDDWEPPGITVHRRMGLSTLALDAELVAWLQRSPSESRFGSLASGSRYCRALFQSSRRYS